MSSASHLERLSFFESIHQSVDDDRFDFYARAIGQPSGIGRLSHITDGVLSTLLQDVPIRSGMRVLDVGCGRGFMGRWLAWRGLDVRYVGIDFSPSAVESARQNVPQGEVVLGDLQTALTLGQFDVIFAIETTGLGVVDADLGRCVFEPLADGGVGIATVVSVLKSFEAASELSLNAIRSLHGEALIRDFTQAVKPSVKRFYELVRKDSELPAVLRRSFRRESDLMLRLFEDGRYGYGALVVKRATNASGTSPVSS